MVIKGFLRLFSRFGNSICVWSAVFFSFNLNLMTVKKNFYIFHWFMAKLFLQWIKEIKLVGTAFIVPFLRNNWKACLSRAGHNPQILLDLHRTLRCKKFVTWNPNESHAIHFSFIPIKSSKNSFEITKAEPSLFLCISKLNSIRTYILCVVFPAYIK